MNLRSLLVCLALLGLFALAANPVSGAPAPAKILKVDAQAPRVLETLSGMGLRLYGQTDHFYLVEDSPGAQGLLSSASMSFTPVPLTPSLPIYLVYLPREEILNRIKPLAPVLFTDGRMVLLQLDEATALRVSQLGGELVRLPEVPFPVYLPSGRGYPRPALLDTFVQRLVSKVNQDSIRAQIQRLQDFRSRYSFADSCRRAEQYVYDYFTALGLDSVALDPYQYQGNTWRNVIGTRLGRVNSRKVIIVCGHMDAITYTGPDTLAPGAEDNASGTVMALEAARILAGENLDLSVKFIAFTGEEQGLIGSQHYAQLMRSQNVDILGVLNFDMVAWPGGAFGVNIYCNQASLPLAQFEDQMAGMYTTLAHRITIGSYGSDQLSFHAQGYLGTAGAEYGGFYPYYHTIADTIGYLSIPLATEVAKMGLASLAVLATSPASPDDFVLRDAGSGGALDAAWLPSLHPDLAGYKLFWGTASRTYTDSVTLGRVTSYRISGLQNGTRYYAAISAFDSLGHEGGRAPEQSAVPGAIPLAPSGLAAFPFYFGMRLTWQRNAERDLAGYNLYRSTTSGGNYIKLNTAVIPDTAYRDSSLLSDTMYYYVVTAVDTSQNESGYSAEVRGKPITLDHGILLVDETRDGTGGQGSPSDIQQDAFYHYILQGTRYTDWDVAQAGIPLAGDVGPYSTIVWHADDYTEFRVSPALPGLANYFSRGGRFWMMGWKPVLGLMLVGGYPYTFASGQFPYDALHLARSEESQLRDFLGASGQLAYPSVSVDSMKANPVLHGKLPYIDTAIPRDAETVLTFNSASGDTFQGKPVGVRWLPGPSRIVFFGFPFYFMKDSEARQVAIKVLQDLGEPVGVEASTPSLPLTTTLFPVHPNPFRGSARIDYSLAAKGKVRLSVYNVQGQLVKELVKGERAPGKYSTYWDGEDQSSRRAPSGVYFYRLDVSDKSWVRKTILLR